MDVPIDDFVKLVEQTTFLVGQASTAVTYDRRLGVPEENKDTFKRKKRDVEPG